MEGEPTNDLRPLGTLLDTLIDRLRANAAGGAVRTEAERLVTDGRRADGEQTP